MKGFYLFLCLDLCLFRDLSLCLSLGLCHDLDHVLCLYYHDLLVIRVNSSHSSETESWATWKESVVATDEETS